MQIIIICIYKLCAVQVKSVDQENNASMLEKNKRMDAVEMTRVITSETLFAGERVLIIIHGANAYQLRLTNQGKLILTK